MTFNVEQGDMFEADADALVNPVNCKGVMGAGVAEQMMDRYPGQCKIFNRESEGLVGVRPGNVYVSMAAQRDTNEDKLVVHVTTKDDWQDPTQLDWIESIAKQLDTMITEAVNAARQAGKDPDSIDYVAMPAIGCGHGGLSWPVVRGILEDELEDTDRTYTVYLLDE